MPPDTLSQRLALVDWEQVREQLDQRGYATLRPILTAKECRSLIEIYDRREAFRSKVDMARLRFGVGEYKYFAAPLPPLVATLRAALYPAVAAIANEWAATLRSAERFPLELDEFLDHCHRQGQTKPTPLMLSYTAGGFNCLHQDLYGEVVFPLQFTIMLSRPGEDFRGGDFLLVEQRPRAQSRGHAIRLEQGAAALFATRYRPINGARGCYRVNVRHGVATVEAGDRFTLGIIFHDAK
jgi:hypothetical protein